MRRVWFYRLPYYINKHTLRGCGFAQCVTLNSILYNGARMVGLTNAGIIITWVGTSWAFLHNGVSFLAVRVVPIVPVCRLSVGICACASYPRQFDVRVPLCRIPSGFKSYPDYIISYGTFGLNFSIFISRWSLTCSILTPAVLVCCPRLWLWSLIWDLACRWQRCHTPEGVAD